MAGKPNGDFGHVEAWVFDLDNTLYPADCNLFAEIDTRMGDSAELIRTLETGSFSAVLHDPPAVNLAGELYAEAFYAEVWRVLGRGGRFFHYIGDPNSASGARTTKGVVRRLQSAGFGRVAQKTEAFGVLAVKDR